MKSIKSAIGITFIVIISYIIPLAFRSLWQPDETRYAEISREMLTSREWIVPHLLGLRYFEKPSLGYWINNLSQLLFGHTNFAVHFSSALSIAITAFIVYWLALTLWQDRWLGFSAALIYSSFIMVCSIGTYAILDPIISLWLTVAMLFFWHAVQASNAWKKIFNYIIVGITCGLGFMTKGFLALVVPLFNVLPWFFLQKRLKEILIYGILVIFCAISISLPWIIAINIREPDFWHYFIFIEHIQRFAKDNAQHKAPFWYYLPIIIVGTLPWLGLFPGALRQAWRKRRTNNELFYLVSWVIMPLIFFSSSKGKLLTYILPCFAPLSILMAYYVTTCSKIVLKINGILNLLIGIICIIAIVVIFAPWGIAQHPIFTQTENIKVLFIIVSFFVWAISGCLIFYMPVSYFHWTVLCPLGICLLVDHAIPQQVIDAKQPQSFIKTVLPQLKNSRFIFANSVGVAAGIAWELRRSDIIMFEERGELAYGLSYPDAIDRFIRKEDFLKWLSNCCKKGSVSLVLLLSDKKSQLNVLHADEIYQRGRLALLKYHSYKLKV